MPPPQKNRKYQMLYCPSFYLLWSLTSTTLQMKCQAMFNIRYCFISTSYISLTEWKRNRKGSLAKQSFEIIQHHKTLCDDNVWICVIVLCGFVCNSAMTIFGFV